MTITKHQAVTADEFHYGSCSRSVGPRGGITEHVEHWRRNGATQTWKRRPDDFRIPVKYGLYRYSQIRSDYYDLNKWHVADDCPLLETPVTVTVDNAQFTGTVTHVRDNGWPVVECSDGHIASGPVSDA
jgi:hypothetical protein